MWCHSVMPLKFVLPLLHNAMLIVGHMRNSDEYCMFHLFAPVFNCVMCECL